MVKQTNKKNSGTIDLSKKKSKQQTSLGIIISIFAFLLYCQSITYEYVYDDYITLKENDLIKRGVSSIPMLFKTDMFYGYAGNDEVKRVPQYRPVPLVIYAITWQFFPDNPHVFHLINVILFSLSCYILFLLLTMFFKNYNIVFPFICVMLFASHPIHTEVVTNIKSLDEILCLLFALLSVLFFARALEKKPYVSYFLAVGSFLLSVFSKESGVSFLLIIPMLLFFFSAVSVRKIIIITIMILCASGVYLIIRYNILEGIPQKSIIVINSPYLNTLVAAPDFLSQKATAFYILLRYVLLLIFPYQLSYDYSIAQIPLQNISSPGAIAGILLYLLMGAYAVYKTRSKSIAAFAILFYIITLAPVSNILILINCTMAERFLYTPSIGFCVMLAFVLIKITKTEFQKKTYYPMWQIIKKNALMVLCFGVITGLYSFRTVTRNAEWKDNVTLFSNDVKVVPKSAKAHFFYGNVLLNTIYPAEKQMDKKKEILKKAASEFKVATTLYKNFPEAYHNLGFVYNEMGDFSNAVIYYEQAFSLSYSTPPAVYFCNLGYAYFMAGHHQKALSILDSSIKYYPKYIDGYMNKIYTYISAGKNLEAIVECNKVIQVDPNEIYAYINKGCCYLNMKDYSNAISSLIAGLKIDSTNTDCLRILGNVYREMGDSLTAKYYFKKETQFQGNN